MRTASSTVSTTGTNPISGDPIILDNTIATFDVGAILVELVDGATVKLQYSMDNPNKLNDGSTVVWTDSASLVSKTATTAGEALTIPCTMVRPTITSGSAGTFRLDVVQFGGHGR